VPYSYLQYDVFTAEPLTGNQLAVFLDGRGLEPERMQSIAREMNFSESTFILPAEKPGTDVRMRIFTPFAELPMAGHPTIGSTFALAQASVIRGGTSRFVFGLGIGPVPVDLEWANGRLRFAWMTQPNPTFGLTVTDIQPVAAALGVRRDAIDGQYPIQQVSCGVPFLFVKFSSRAAVDEAVSEASAVRRLATVTGLDLPIFLFHVDVDDDVTVYSRMFAPQFGIAEDPATGSASGPLGCYLLRHRIITPEVAHRIVNLQGVAMGRPSRIHVAIDGTPEQITRVRVGGEAVLVAKGELLV
jgi:trans-2,3-dihydro-3-hydroxyanthranilate isomerase